MDAIREYLIGVVAAALLCGIITTIIGTKGTVGVAVKLLSGLLMLLAVIRPWTSITFDGFFDWSEGIAADGTGIVTSGEMMAEEAYHLGIKKQIESYILDKARALDCNLKVEVILSDGSIPVPKQVRLTGELSPYARRTLTNEITQHLGIDQEDLIWI